MENDRTFRGFKSYRHFLNSKLHALSCVICGDDTLLDENLSLAGVKSVKDLDLQDARKLYFTFSELAKEASGKTNEIKSAIGLGAITNNQRAMIIKLTRYKWNWTPEATFSFILGILPEKRTKLSKWEIENSRMAKLYSILSAKEADKIIKHLLQIEKRNENDEKKGSV